MRIYTKTGDKGTTGLIGGTRVPKHDPRVGAYGDVDELNAVLGVAVAHLPPELGAEAGQLLHIQRVLFDLGAELATPPGARKARWALAEGEISRLEEAIDAMEGGLEPLRTFILPGGHPAGAQLHLARTVARRAERAVTALAAQNPVEEKLLRYLNRLSDYLFVLSRHVNSRLNAPERPVSDEPLWT
ncbi:MAG: cob(I)yrinic acid a,c-diamide adenosyltransferase [Candidatus Sericytochromatia bacterium]|nr:cob(I)yrinic acid a,c-diamide adenosyltransferase [Candidatus Tanganyikabacteria bacterium]